MKATQPFHSVNQIPDGSTLQVEASAITGNVARFGQILQVMGGA